MPRPEGADQRARVLDDGILGGGGCAGDIQHRAAIEEEVAGDVEQVTSVAEELLCLHL